MVVVFSFRATLAPATQQVTLFLNYLAHGFRLRPSFEISPALSLKVDSLYQKMVSLTQQQYEIVDAAEESDRILCTGGAGTGKSLVAMEVAETGIEIILKVFGKVLLVFKANKLGSLSLENGLVPKQGDLTVAYVLPFPWRFPISNPESQY